MATTTDPSPKAVRVQLKRILQSDEFRGSQKQREFLEFVVEETLQGRASQIKGYTVAVTVYGRKAGFDPQVDPIVRVEAGRLRRALERYYLTAGKNDPLRIEIPKGAYVPVFRTIQLSGDEVQPAGRIDSTLPTGPSIAVMPLVNLGGNNEQDYFAEGLTEEMTAELARYQEFQVIASQSTMQLKDQTENPKVIGRELDVQFLLTGSIRTDAKAVKVTIRLLETATAEQIWGESYTREPTAADLISVQEEIARNVVGTIADHYGLITRRLSAESRKKVPTDLRAYDAVLRFYHYESVLTPAAFKKALSALERAVEIDPEYGLAWAMLGHLHADNYAVGFIQMEAPLEKALTFAQKGVALAPRDQFVRDALTLVYFHQGDKKQFLQHLEQTIALNPNAPYIVGVAGWHMMLYGEWERGLALLKKGMKLNPYHPSWFHLATYMNCYRRGEYENALVEALKFNFPDLYLDPMMRAAALGKLGREAEAKTAIGQLLILEPEFAARGRQLVGRYVKVDELVDQIVDGLREAGLADAR